MPKPPLTITINGKVHMATVVRVKERDPDGTPRTLELLKPGESAKLTDNVSDNVFFVVWALPEINEKRN